MKEYKRNKYIGLAGTVTLHVIILLLSWLLFIRSSQNTEESGVPVMLGNQQLAQGESEPYTLTKVDITTAPPQTNNATPNLDANEEPLLTQEDEETVVVKKTEKKNTQKKKKETKSVSNNKSASNAKPVVTPEKSEAEKKAEAERKAAEAAAKSVAGAFGKGNAMGSKGNSTTQTGNQGSMTGNSTVGNTSGVGGYGTFDLGGRQLGGGGLPRPIYNVQDEGKVVVTITVNPVGKVVATSIHKETNTVNPALRKAAIDAAKKAIFNAVDRVDNQIGTITYYFNLK